METSPMLIGSAHPRVVKARHVGVVLGNDPCNGGQRAGTVIEHHADRHVPAGGGEAPLDDLQHQHGVDVAAGQDDGRGSGVFDLSVHEGSHPHGTGRLHHHLGALQQEDQGPRQGVLADGDHVIHEFPDDAEGQLSGTPHGDAVGHG